MPIRNSATYLLHDLIPQIIPARVHCFDQLDLPRSTPFLELLLAGNRSLGGAVDFVSDQLDDVVAVGETAGEDVVTDAEKFFGH